MNEPLRTLIVHRKEIDGNRVLLYPKPTNSRMGDYHVIATVEGSSRIHAGDEISYEPYGFNFGFLVRKTANGSTVT